MRKIAIINAALFAGLLTASATITPYSWLRFDTYKRPTLDATGQNHSMQGGYTPGNAESPYCTQPVFGNISVGGPLGPEGYLSTTAIRSSANGNQGVIYTEPYPLVTGLQTNTGAWGNFFQENGDWVAECWYLPSMTGSQGAVPIFFTGLSRNNRSPNCQSGVALMSINGTSRVDDYNRNDGNAWVRLQAICPPMAVDTNGNTMDFYIGPPVQVKTPTSAAWMHFAVVRDTVAGTVSWYTNGVLVAATNIWRVYTTNVFSSPGLAGLQDCGYAHPNDGTGTVGAGKNGGIGMDGAAQRLRGYTAELRFSSFNPGEFSVTNLLTRRIAPGNPTVWNGPAVVTDPQNITVWEGGGAPFVCIAATDTDVTYQWQRYGGGWVNIPGATDRVYVKESAAVASDNGAQFRCLLSKGSLTATSGAATLTVVASNESIVKGYSDAIMAETSLVGFWPVDASAGSVLTNLKDSAHNGNILNLPYAFRNGDTNKAGGKQTLSLNTPNFGYTGGFGLCANQYGYAEIQGDNPGYDFYNNSGGNGTIEAVLYLEPSAKTILSSEQCTWLSSATVPNSFDYYSLKADAIGNLYFRSSAQGADFIWNVTSGLVGKRTHVAFVFSNNTNVTCYANGVSLGTKITAGLGNTPPDASQPLTIGKRGGEVLDQIEYMPNLWRGSVDDLAIYNTALSPNAIAKHYYTLISGSTPTPASVARISPSKNLYVGFPGQILNVTAGGTPPYNYQWFSNSVPLLGETNFSLNIPSLPVKTYNYSVSIQGSVGGAITSAPVVLTVVAPTGYDAKVFASSGGAPKAYYPLNETSGGMVLDWAGTHDGVLSGAYLQGASGPATGTGSLKMFGTNVNATATLSQVTIPYYPELNPASGAMTHEFWYKPDDVNVTVCATSSQFNIGNNRAGLAVMEGPGINGFGQNAIKYWTINCGKYNNVNQGVGQGAGQMGLTPPTPGEWVHVAVVLDGPNSLATLYVNGVAEYTTGVGYVNDPNGAAAYVWNQNLFAPLILGNYFNGGAYPMKGQLSEVAIYDYALTPQDITNHTSQVWSAAQIPTQANGSQLNPVSSQLQGYVTNGTYFVVTNVPYGPVVVGQAVLGSGVPLGTTISSALGGTLATVPPVPARTPPGLSYTNYTVLVTNTIYTTNGLYTGPTNTSAFITNGVATSVNFQQQIVANQSGNVLTALDVNWTNSWAWTVKLTGYTNIINVTNTTSLPISTNVTSGTTVLLTTNTTVTGVTALSVGCTVNGGASAGNPVITKQLTGAPGGVGTYSLSVGGQATAPREIENVSLAGGVGVYLLSATVPNGALNAYAGPTVVEGINQTYTLSIPAVLGTPNAYQWYKDGNAIGQRQNLDGTDKYPWIGTVASVAQGTNALVLKITELKTNDTGLYTLQVNNAISGVTNTTAVYLLVLNDTTKPTVSKVAAKGTTFSGPILDNLNQYTTSGTPTPPALSLVEITFSKRMDPTTATNPANYTLNGGAAVTSVYLAQDVRDSLFGSAYQTIGLITTGLQQGSPYTLGVTNVLDEASYPNANVPTVVNFVTPALNHNVAVWSYYYKVVNPYMAYGNFEGIASGTNYGFPYVPLVVSGVTNFSSDAIAYNGTLNNNPTFAPVGGTNQADDYVSTISAWVTPTNSGYYEFFINADDGARLFVSTSADPAGAQLLGDANSGSTVFSDIYQQCYVHPLLQAGESYFVEAVHYENAGNDSVRVAWRYLGTQDVPYDGTGINGAWLNQYDTNLVPIAGTFLSAYTAPPPIIGTQPVGFVAPVGRATNMWITVLSTSTGVTNITWQRANAGTTAFSTVSGRTGLTNVFSSVANSDFGDWRAVVDDGTAVNPINSSAVQVRPPTFTITPLPTPQVAPQGLPHNLTVTSTAASGSTGYQWRLNGVNLLNNAYYGNVTAQTLNIKNYQSARFGNYDVIVNDGYHSVTSSVAVVSGIAAMPTMTSSVSGTNYTLEFPVEAGPQYLLQYKNTLKDAAWTTLTTITAPTAMTTNVTVSTTTPATRFYRINVQ